MAFEFNKVMLTGNLARDAEPRFTPDGTPVVSFSFCNNTTTKSETKQLWVKAAWFGNTAQKVAEYLVKGKGIFVTGRLEMQEYTDKDGNQRQSLSMRVDDLQLLGAKPEAGEGGNVVEGAATLKPLAAAVKKGRPTKQAELGFADDEDDDTIPF